MQMSRKSAATAGACTPRDPRARRTRSALIAAFNRIFLATGTRGIDVGRVTGEAGVGRSTFYAHYAGADDLLLDALRTPFALLADVAVGQGDAARLEALLRHFWENRQRGRTVLAGPLGARVETLLVDLIEARLGPSGPLAGRLSARMLAGAMLGPVRAWLSGEAQATAEALAAVLAASGAAMRRSLADG